MISLQVSDTRLIQALGGMSGITDEVSQALNEAVDTFLRVQIQEIVTKINGDNLSQDLVVMSWCINYNNLNLQVDFNFSVYINVEQAVQEHSLLSFQQRRFSDNKVFGKMLQSMNNIVNHDDIIVESITDIFVETLRKISDAL